MQSPSGQPSIDLFGLTIMEPVVMLTNFLISAVCIFAFTRLKRISSSSSIHQYFRGYFLFMALATFFGGTLGHAVQYIVGPQGKLLGWICSMISIFLISHASMLHASTLLGSKYAKPFKIVNVLALLSFSILSIQSINFSYVEIHSVFGFLLLILPIQIVVYIKTRNTGSKFLILTICFTSLSAIVFSSKLSLGPWFTHLDISHTVIAFSMYFFYLSSLRISVGLANNSTSSIIHPIESN